MRLVLLLSALAVAAAAGADASNAASSTANAFGKAGALTVQVAQDDRPSPILIRRTQLFTPPEMVGSELEPEVAVRLQVDETGRVTRVTADDIRPSSDFDELIRSNVSEELSRWRFAPAIEDGQPQASEVQLSLQYRAFASTDDELVVEMQDDFFLGNPELREAEALRLPFDQRKIVIDSLAAVADRHLVAEHRRRADSARFVVVTDARREETAEAVAGNLEAAYQTFEEIFGGHLEPQPEKYKQVAYFFSSQAALNKVQSDLRNTTLGAGFYKAPGFLAFHQEVLDPGELLGTLIHEAFHSFSDRKLRPPGRVGLLWLEEGLAEYFGNSEVKRGRLVPGRALRRKFLIHHGRVLKLDTQTAFELGDVKRAVRAGEAPSIAELFSSTRQDFFGEQVRLNYSTSWLLVHFLRHGEPEWEDGEFPSFLLYVYEGYPAEAALELVYGLSAQDAEPLFQEYVKKF